MPEEKKDSKKGPLSEEKEKPEHSAHVKKLKHGYHIAKKHMDGSETEHASEDLDGAMDHVMDHMQEAQQPEGQGEGPMPQPEMQGGQQ